MSYSILYNRQFVKVQDDLFIPMIQAGDNNVYESDRKRARSWYNHRYVTNGSIWASSGTIMETIDKMRQDTIERKQSDIEQGHSRKEDAYDDKGFGWLTGIALYGRHTSGTTFGMYRNFYKSGIDKALTVEELMEKNVRLHMKIYFWSPEDITSKGKEIKPSVTFSSTEHLVQTVKEWEEYYGELSYRISLYFYDDWSIEELVKSQKQKKSKEKRFVETAEYFALEGVNGGNGYFIKATARGYRYAYTATGGKKFLTEQAANRFHNRMKYKDLFKVIHVQNQYTVSVLA